MKILQIMFSGLGGHGSVVFSLLRGAGSASHTHVLLFFGIEDLSPGYIEACAELGVRYHFVKKRRGIDLRAWSRIVAILRKEAPDTVLLHSLSLIAAAGAYRLAAPRSRLVAVEHTPLAVKRKVDWICSAMALRMADGVVYLTEQYARAVRDRLGRVFRPARIHVVGNGVDTTVFAPPSAPIAARRGLRVGMLARFSTGKDHATLLRAVARLRGQHPSGDPRGMLQLVLAGDGETFAATKALAAELGLGADECQFLGSRPEHELPAILQGLDIYVQSSFGETMSTAVMQAMAVGLPVVASDVPGLQNMVEDGATGLLVPGSDDAALASAIDRLWRSPDERARLGRAACAHARLRWSHDTMFRSYEAVLVSLRPGRRNLA
jgi:glycosyltransferase involved in cell wall biosynthesis